MNRFPRTSLVIGVIQWYEPTHDAKYSSATHPTWFLLGFEKRLDTWCKTRWFEFAFFFLLELHNRMPCSCSLFLAEQVDCIVTSAGGVEEDIIKCLSPTYIGDFVLK